MDNENKWEYDYSSEHSQTGETGYPNVGSSGMNTANTAGTYGEAAQAAPQAEPNSGSDGGAVPPPEGPRYQAAQGSPKQPPKKRRRKNSNIARSAVALVLAAAMGFVGGFVGAQVGNSALGALVQGGPKLTVEPFAYEQSPQLPEAYPIAAKAPALYKGTVAPGPLDMESYPAAALGGDWAAGLGDWTGGVDGQLSS